MKKLMIAAAVAAMGVGAFADDCTPEEIKVARIYQVQMNVYTTKGVAQNTTISTGSQCAPGTAECVVRRGKDKTMFRGYIYVCENLCDISQYACVMADVTRKHFFQEQGEEMDGAFTWTLLNFGLGSNLTDVEAAWTFEGTVKYDEQREQTYTLTGAGYGQLRKGETVFADNLSGYFAGTATPSFDLKTKYNTAMGEDNCLCNPSSVLTCDTFGDLDFEALDTVAFGTWKMKFNANASEGYYTGKFNPVSAVRKLFK